MTPTPDPALVERVARVLCRANCEDPDKPEVAFLSDIPTGYPWQGYIPHAEAAIAALRAAGWREATEPQWQPIATAPKSTTMETPHGHDVRGAYFLAYCPDESVSDPKACICVCWWEPHMDGGKGRWQGEGDFPLRPTHWMPLPEPPEKR